MEARVANLEIVIQPSLWIAESGVSFVQLLELDGGDRVWQLCRIGMVALAQFPIGAADFLC